METTEPHGAATVRTGVHERLMEAEVARAMFAGLRRAPVKAGRFVVVDRVGSGGMGTVFRAYDPELDRSVALKVLKASASEGPAARERLQREAVALARLSHPNVVTVHEVGEVGGELFVAMEYVEGVDLGKWMTEHPVGPRGRFLAALRLLQQAGQGLAAAHGADLVHRDFKPSNVLVGDDGRVRVADFGLVRGGRESSGEGVPATSSGPQRELTQTGATLGTPKYMSLEQQHGKEVDARSDQFSFCVAAWEVLLGAPPWDGPFPSPGDTPPRVPDDAPGWVVDVLARGLQADPDRRYPSMQALLGALSRDPHRRRRRLLGAGGILAVAAVAAAGYVQHREALCDDGPERLGETWNDGLRVELRRQFTVLQPDGGAEAWDLADGHLTRFGQGWLETFESVCDAGRRRGTMSEAELAAAMGCLELERAQLAAAIDLLRATDVASVNYAADVATHPGGKRRCDRPRAADALPADPAEARALLEVSRELEKVRILRSTARYEQGAEIWERLEPTLATVEHPAVDLPATLIRTSVLDEQGRPNDAVELARPAYYAATEQGNDYAARMLAARLTDFALERGDPDVALVWYELVRVHARRAPIGPRDQAYVEMLAARVSLARDDVDTALDFATRGVELMESAHGPAHPYTLQLVSTLARVKMRAGDLEEGAALFDRAHEGFVAAYGPNSPRLVKTLHNAYVARIQLGQYDEALTRARLCVELAKSRWPSGHVGVAGELAGYAAAASAAGKLEEAVEVMREAAAMFQGLGLQDSGDGLYNQFNLASSLASLGRFEEAVVVAEQTAHARARVHGAEHADTAVVLDLLGMIQTSLGRLELAEQTLTRAKSILEKGGPEDASVLQEVLVDLACLAKERGDLEAALAQLAPVVDKPASDAALSLALTCRAGVLEQLRRPDDALKDAARVIGLPRYQTSVANMRALRSRMLMSLGRRSEAVAEAELGLEEAKAREDPIGVAELEAARRTAKAGPQ